MASQKEVYDKTFLSRILVDESKTPAQRTELIWKFFLAEREPSYFDALLRGHVQFHTASIDPADSNHAFASFSMKVPQSLCSGMGGLHGGAVAFIFDMCTLTAIALIARHGWWDKSHFSRTLNCTYLRSAPLGTEVLIETEVVHVGKAMAQLRGTMRLKDSGKICYICDASRTRVDADAFTASTANKL